MKLHPDVRKLLAEIYVYCARTDMTLTRFGLEAVNDGHLVDRLWVGHEPRRAKVERVRAYMKRKGKR